jgi:hypothetical protein
MSLAESGATLDSISGPRTPTRGPRRVDTCLDRDGLSARPGTRSRGGTSRRVDYSPVGRDTSARHYARIRSRVVWRDCSARRGCNSVSSDLLCGEQTGGRCIEGPPSSVRFWRDVRAPRRTGGGEGARPLWARDGRRTVRTRVCRRSPRGRRELDRESCLTNGAHARSWFLQDGTASRSNRCGSRDGPRPVAKHGAEQAELIFENASRRGLRPDQPRRL